MSIMPCTDGLAAETHENEAIAHFDEFGHDYLSERFRRYGYKDLRIDFEDDDYF